MKTKKFKHKELEICSLSQKKINTSKDDYSIIVDCRGDEMKSIKFYKTELLINLIKAKGEKVIQELQQRTYGLARNILRKAGIIKPVFEVGE